MKYLLILSFLVSLNQARATDQSFVLPWMNAPAGRALYQSKEYSGSVFIIVPFFEKCISCGNNVRELNELAAQYGGDNRVQVIEVGIDQKDDSYLKWISKYRPNHPVLKDAGGELISRLKATTLPEAFLMDCQGRIVYRMWGEWEPSDRRALSSAIDALTKSACHATPEEEDSSDKVSK